MMKLLSGLNRKGVRTEVADSGREAARHAGRGAQRGAKRGAGLGALKGFAQGVRRTIADRDIGRKQSTFDQARDRARAAAGTAKENAKALADVAAGPVRRRRGRSKAKTAAAGAGAAGAAAAGVYFLDPQSGARRRHIARDRIGAFLRRGAQKARRQAGYRKGQVTGAAKQAASDAGPEKPAPNDEALADRVRSELFQPADAPKDSVNVNVVDGVVYLRGEVDTPDEVDDLAERANSIDGVRSVENLLHTPGTKAPTA